ncbi:MAG: precorrin-3B C(17)-methyltransferase [Dehalococcoidaceae bacterium]|nr:precorrin-3B C(17)-methyltransferase [Dehalococcoidaceae bacterium]
MKGKVYLVGIGTGNPADLTPRAKDTLLAAGIIIGHEASLKSVAGLLGGKRVVGGTLSPVERSSIAVDFAEEGETVAIISSGDPGVYAIAATFFNYLKENNIAISVEIVAGITTASSAAALLGSPLGNDFAVISLADQASRWQATRCRIEQAVSGDFVIVLYNPLGKIGPGRLEELLGILNLFRQPATPVGLVRGAGCEKEYVKVVRLCELKPSDIDNDTLVIVGNSETYVYDGWMVTPRAYQPGLGY